MVNKVMVTLLVLLVMASTTLGVYMYRLTGEVDSLGDQLEAMRAEQAERGDAVDSALEALRQDTAERLDTLGERVDENRDAALGNRDTIAALQDTAEESSEEITKLRAEVGDLAAEVARTGEESWLKADEVYQVASQAVVEVSNGEATIGSGFVYDALGHVVTANHVTENLSDIYLVFADGQVSPASLVGSCSLSDVAVLKIQRDPGVTPLALADSDAIAIGEPVVTLGSPFDLTGTITAGIVSQRDRFEEIGSDGGSRWIANLIQFDAPANFGNSGGPLVNADGQVVGLIIARVGPASGEGVSYAVSANKVRRVADAIIEGGVFQYPWLGVEGGDLTPKAAEQAGRDSLNGVLVSTVIPGGPAWAGGMQAGDIITSIDGWSVAGIADLTSYLGERTSPGDLVTIEVVRNGVARQFQATIGTR